MTDKKISQLDVAGALTGAEMIEVVQNGVNVRTTATAVSNTGAADLHAYKYSYSFAVDGGATGTLVLRSASGALPSGFIVQYVFVDVLTILGSAGAATAALATPQSVGDILAATAFGSPPWSNVGFSVCTINIAATSTWLKLTASRSPTLTIAGAALNAGIFNLFVLGVMA